MIRETLVHVASAYAEARRQSLTSHPLANFLRHAAADEIAQSLAMPDLRVVGSPGQGYWAAVPWIAVLDPVVTTSATRGYYVVYLFSADMERVYLSLNQGTTAIRNEFGSGAIEELKRRATLMRARVPEFGEYDFTPTAIELSAGGYLPQGYEAGHAFGARYDTSHLPDEDQLEFDLQAIASLYLTLTKRGSLGTFEDEAEEGDETVPKTIEEKRQYRLHRKIERSTAASKEAKRIHGYVCQACGFDFEEAYGELGNGYIEAHHLIPLATIPEGQSVPMDPEKDFAVLCANCHRMVHRTKPPKKIEELRALSGVQRLRSRN